MVVTTRGAAAARDGNDDGNDDDNDDLERRMSSSSSSSSSTSSNSSSDESNHQASIAVLGEVEFDHAVRLSSWSPTMDLFVVAYEGANHLDLYHMNLRKLWSVQSDVGATALAWKPDGSSLAVGYEDGTISLVETETGETHACVPATAATAAAARGSPPVVLLHWQDASDWAPKTAAAESRNGRPAGTAGRRDPRAAGDAGEEEGVASLGAGFSLLCSCDAGGTLQVSANGVIPLARASLAEEIRAKATESAARGGIAADAAVTSIAPLALSANTSFTRVLISASCEIGSPSLQRPARVLASVLVDASRLSARRREIWRWSTYIAILEGRVSQLRQTQKALRPQISHLERAYPALTTDKAAKDDFGPPRAHQMSRKRLAKSLLLGYSAIVNAMVAQKSCKTAASDVDKALAKTYQILTHALVPQLEAIYEHIQGSAGAGARASNQGGWFFPGEGEGPSVARVFDHAAGAISLARRLQPLLLGLSRQAREYFSWLHASQLSLDKEELPHSQVKALLQSQRMCGALVLGNRQGGTTEVASSENRADAEEGGGYMDWDGAMEVVEAFQEEVCSLIYCFGTCMGFPSTIFSDQVTVDRVVIMDAIPGAAGEERRSHDPHSVAMDLVLAQDTGEDCEEGEGAGDFWNLVAHFSDEKSAPLPPALYTVREDGSFERMALGSDKAQGLAPGWFCFYKWPFLAWIASPGGADEDEAGGEATMVVSSRKDVGFVLSHPYPSGARGGSEIRSRPLGEARVQHFAVSTNRGTAYVQDTELNVVVFDLEDDQSLA